MTGSNNLQDAGAVTTCQMMSHHLPLAYLQSHMGCGQRMNMPIGP